MGPSAAPIWAGVYRAFRLFVLQGLLMSQICVIEAWAQQNPQPETKTSTSSLPDAPSAKRPGDTNDNNGDDEQEIPSSVHGLFGRFVGDQKQMWTSPARVRFADTEWLVPLAGITAGLFVTDSEFNRHLNHSPATISRYTNISNAGVAALAGGAGGMFLMGHVRHNKHWSETGFLAGEAAINSLVATEGLKYSLRRDRPLIGDGGGAFFQSGGTSFPSEHSAAAWAVAGVVAHEYPGPFTKIMAYGLASLVSVSRVKAEQHFPSDVLVGAVIGELVAQNIYRRHHNPELGGEGWESVSEKVHEDAATNEGSFSPRNYGSPYVPLDSWIYPALDRLSALGVIDSGFAGLRPWTRRECARLLSEAGDNSADVDDLDPEAQGLLAALESEFHYENEGSPGSSQGSFRVESLYSRTEHISGMPLTDGYTFGQTQINDFGRPYGEGWSTVNGFSAYATRGPWVAYIRGEEQSAPSIPAYSLSTRQVIEQVNDYPQLPPDTGRSSIARFNLLDAYVGLTASNWEFSFGRQSLSWGPGEGGSMTLSDNAEPVNMFRISQTTPLKLGSIFSWLGSMRSEFFFGQLAGQEFLANPSGLVGQFGQSLSPQPFIHGQKVSFKPTPNLEFGIFRTTIYGGPGYPLTIHTLLRSLFSPANENAGSAVKPGNRTSGVDLTYRLPGMRNWATFYVDGYSDDEFSPIAYADRSAWRSGLYFSHFPFAHKLDLRAEGVYTDNPIGGAVGHGFYYFNFTWRSGYTNNGSLMGNWIGRDGQGAQVWSNYWFGARNRVQFNFRHQKVSNQFIPNGGTLTDFGVRGDYWLRSNIGLSAWVQHERWLFPVIEPGIHRNITAAVQIEFQPRKVFQRSATSSQ